MRRNALKQSLRITLTAICWLAFVQAHSPQSGTAEAVITSPKAGATIPDRKKFVVQGTVEGYQQGLKQGFHYWVSLAQSLDGKLGKGHWPKFYVQKELIKGTIHDGGCNPLPIPEEKKIVVLKTDAETHARILQWFREGRMTTQFPRMPLDSQQVIAEILVFFPPGQDCY